MIKLLIFLLLGAALALGGLGWAWRVAPLTAHAADVTAVMAAAAESEVRAVGRKGEVVYVSPPEVASTLRVGTTLRVEPWTLRPEDLGCVGPAGKAVAAACDSNDYVHVAVQSIPFWVMALVSVSTRHGRLEKLLVRFGAGWKVVGTRGYAV